MKVGLGLAENSEELFRALTEQAPVGVFVTDTEGKCVFSNSRVCALTGLTAEQSLGFGWTSGLHPDDAERVTAEWLEASASGRNFVSEYRFVRPDGAVAWVETSARAIRDKRSLTVGWVGIVVDLTQRNKLAEELNGLAFHDALTGLPNRLVFGDRLRQALARAERDRRWIAVMTLDLDNFKLVNDSLGHAAGDELLRLLAPALECVLRPGDTLARFGGDEFAFLIEGEVGEHGIVEVAERILAVLAEPILIETSRQRVSGSLGIVIAQPNESAEVLLRNADTAMYRAKEQGRGRYELFDASMRAKIVREHQVQEALADALEAKELKVCYQPIIALDDYNVLGLEALVRWQHSQWGWVQPNEFIPIAEETGRIRPLSQHVLAMAALQAREWRTRLPSALVWGIALNISPQELSDAGWLDHFERTVAEHGAEPADFTVEVTERAFLNAHNDNLARNLRGLHGIGVRLSLDDFGTGYSALSSLRQFPFSIVKIDRFFIRRIKNEQSDAPITAAITNLAHSLGMNVIAEGVETQLQADALRQIGCDAAQGYHFARPAPASHLESLLRDGPPFALAHSAHFANAARESDVQPR